MRRLSFTAEFYAMDCYQVSDSKSSYCISRLTLGSGTNCTQVETQPTIRCRINAILLTLCIRD